MSASGTCGKRRYMRLIHLPSGTHSTRSRRKVRNISWKRRMWLNSSQR